MSENLNTLPTEVLKKIALYLDVPSFLSFASVSKSCLAGARAAKYPLEEVVFHTVINDGTQLCVSIWERRYSHTPSASFTQQTPTTVFAGYGTRVDDTFEETLTFPVPTHCHVPAMEYFIRLITNYRVQKIGIDLYKLPEATDLMRRLIGRSKIKCQVLEVDDATVEQIDLLSSCIEAESYRLKIDIDYSKPSEHSLKLTPNLLRATGTLACPGFCLAKDVELLRFSEIRCNQTVNISLDTIVQWAENWSKGAPFSKNVFYFQRVPLKRREIEFFVESQKRKRFTHSEVRTLGDGNEFIRMAIGYVRPDREMSILEFSTPHGNNSNFWVAFFNARRNA